MQRALEDTPSALLNCLVLLYLYKQKMTQQQYIEASVKVFAKYGINEFQTPMEDRVQFSKSQKPKPGSPEALQVGTYPYRELIGTLLWVSNGTRPDATYLVNTLAKFTHNPGLIHWRASLRVLGYLNKRRTTVLDMHNKQLQKTLYLKASCEVYYIW